MKDKTSCHAIIIIDWFPVLLHASVDMSNVHYISMPVMSDATPGYPPINNKHKFIHVHQPSLLIPLVILIPLFLLRQMLQ